MNINDFTEKERKIISKFFDMNTVFNPYDESLLEIDIHWDYIYSIPEFAALKTYIKTLSGIQNQNWFLGT